MRAFLSLWHLESSQKRRGAKCLIFKRGLLETRSATPNFLRDNRLGFHSPHPPPPPHCWIQMGRSRTETSRSTALGRVHSEK